MSVLTVDEAKGHLRNVKASDEGLLAVFVDAAEAAVAAKCGPLEPTEFIERVKGGRPGLVLRHTPVISVESVTPVGGSEIDVDSLDVDDAGVIEWGSGARFAVGRYDVAYTAGRETCPPDLLMGVLELVKHTWESQRGAGDALSPDAVQTSAYLFVYRVQEYIGPHIQVGN